MVRVFFLLPAVLYNGFFTIAQKKRVGYTVTERRRGICLDVFGMKGAFEMNLLEAAAIRVSRRSFIGPIGEEDFSYLQELAVQYSGLAEVEIRLSHGLAPCFKGFHASYGMFSGVEDGFLLGGAHHTADHMEKLGYYGELLVLEATARGVGTCWVGGTYRQDMLPSTSPELVDIVIVAGQVEQRGLKEKAVYSMVHRGRKSLSQMYRCDETPPDWFLRGVECAVLAPSAVNRQPVTFHWMDGRAFASVPDMGDFRPVDMGIAKAHFALAAGGDWQWGNGGNFIPSV